MNFHSVWRLIAARRRRSRWQPRGQRSGTRTLATAAGRRRECDERRSGIAVVVRPAARDAPRTAGQFGLSAAGIWAPLREPPLSTGIEPQGGQRRQGIVENPCQEPGFSPAAGPVYQADTEFGPARKTKFPVMSEEGPTVVAGFLAIVALLDARGRQLRGVIRRLVPRSGRTARPR
ncbi:hypothetical protein AHiyo1_19140 [Arthrobacter sp. Hiyo1]|nr:hypothetical protein AHiyo1_19140 [Arthrobacter sp. Hiyo1]